MEIAEQKLVDSLLINDNLCFAGLRAEIGEISLLGRSAEIEPEILVLLVVLV